MYKNSPPASPKMYELIWKDSSAIPSTSPRNAVQAEAKLKASALLTDIPELINMAKSPKSTPSFNAIILKNVCERWLTKFMRKFFKYNGQADAETGEGALRKAGADGDTVDEIVNSISDNDHPGHGRDRRETTFSPDRRSSSVGQVVVTPVMESHL